MDVGGFLTNLSLQTEKFYRHLSALIFLPYPEPPTSIPLFFRLGHMVGTLPLTRYWFSTGWEEMELTLHFPFSMY